MNEQTVANLQNMAKKMRRNIVEMIGEAKSGHPGGSLSATEIVTYLYFEKMNIDPLEPKWDNRDRFVLSKGHAAPVLYAALANRGFFAQESLYSLRKYGSQLQGHPDMNKLPGVDMSTGSLGTGISAAVGMALAGKLDKKDYTVYGLLGDGELEEGQVWEAAMAAAHYQLNNLIVFVDNNGLQIDGNIEEVLSPAPIAQKFEAFGWYVQEIDGHDFYAIEQAVENAQKQTEKPGMIVAKTIKGKGVSYMENQASWHGNAPKPEQVILAMEELK